MAPAAEPAPGRFGIPITMRPLSTDAALRAERIACRLRHLIYSSTTIRKGDYLKSASVMHGINITYENEVLAGDAAQPAAKTQAAAERRVPAGPPLFRPGAVRQSEHFAPLPGMVVCFAQVYDQTLPTRRVRDYDNLEEKQILDLLSSFVMADDSLPELTESEMFGEMDTDAAAADALPGDDDAALTEGSDSDDGEGASAVPADDGAADCPPVSLFLERLRKPEPPKPKRTTRRKKTAPVENTAPAGRSFPQKQSPLSRLPHAVEDVPPDGFEGGCGGRSCLSGRTAGRGVSRALSHTQAHRRSPPAVSLQS